MCMPDNPRNEFSISDLVAEIHRSIFCGEIFRKVLLFKRDGVDAVAGFSDRAGVSAAAALVCDLAFLNIVAVEQLSGECNPSGFRGLVRERSVRPRRLRPLCGRVQR